MYRAKVGMVQKHIKAGFFNMSPESDMKESILTSKTSMFKTVMCFDDLKKSEIPHLSPILYDDTKSVIICGMASNIDKVVLKDLTSSDKIIEFYQPYGQSDRDSYFCSIARKYLREAKIAASDTVIKKFVELTGVTYTGDTSFLYYETVKLVNLMKLRRVTTLEMNQLNSVDSEGDIGFFHLFDELISLTKEKFNNFSNGIIQALDKDPQFLYGFFSYAYNSLTLLLASTLDTRSNTKEIASILGKKEFYLKTVLGKKISKRRASLLLSIIVESLVSLETSQGDSVGHFLMAVYMGIEKGI